MTLMDVRSTESRPRRNLVRDALALLREHRRAYLIINLVYYGLIPVGMLIATLQPSIQESLMESVGVAFGEEGFFAPVTEAYTTGAVLQAIGLTFIINLIVGSLLSITVPSLIIPFSGLVVGAFRALVWGFLFAPAGFELEMNLLSVGIGVWVAILLLLEGQAYVLAMLGAYFQGRGLLFWRRAEVESLGQGVLLGLKQTALVYVLVVLTLIVAALWEVTSVLPLPLLS